jgi:hypothetical protein
MPDARIEQEAAESVAGEILFRISLLLLVACALLQLWVVSISSGVGLGFIVDFIDGGRVFGTDDSYRYYMARAIWRQPGIFNWSYDLPVGLLLDHLLVSISNANLLAARIIRILCEFLSLFFLYKAGVILRLNRGIVAFSLLLLAAMPLYALVFMSFLGEGWLILFICLGIYLFVSGRHAWCALVFGLSMLIRPEAVALAMPLGLFMLFKGRFRDLILLALPLFLYWAHMLMSDGGFYRYVEWRLLFRQEMNIVYIDWLYHPERILSTFNPLWTLPALFFLFTPRLRGLWPLWAGLFILWGYNIGILIKKEAFYEARYFLPVIPLLALSWAALFTDLLQKSWLSKKRSAFLFVFSVLTILIVSEDLMQSDPLKARYANGQRAPFAGPPQTVTSYKENSAETFAARHEALDRIYSVLQERKSVDALVIYDPYFFYILDPGKIPDRVAVYYSPVSYYITIKYYDGSFFTIHPGGNQYEYFNFSKARVGDARTALFVGALPFTQAECAACVPVYEGAGVKLYNFSYRVSPRPNKMPDPSVREDVTDSLRF